jgi:hypothetical protein
MMGHWTRRIARRARRRLKKAFSRSTLLECGMPMGHLDDLPVQELDPIVLPEHPRLPMRWYSSMGKRRRGIRTAAMSGFV